MVNILQIKFTGNGGAIFSDRNGKNLQISNCSFYNNSALDGGAIYNLG